jgi:MFS family permease
VGFFLDKLGRKNSILVGYVIMIFATVGFGLLSFINDSLTFFILAMLMRAL